MKPILHIPNDILTKPAKTVKTFDMRLHQLVENMIKTLNATKKPKGVGLAAPQIGEPYRVFITKPTPQSDIRVFINPEIIGISNENNDEGALLENKNKQLEGCLSIPNIWGHVTRAQAVTLRYQDLEGKFHEEVIDGFLATIVQHETDHTNGILFTQRVLEQHGKLYKIVKNQNGEEIFEEIPIR
ncbi:MAG: peptide deformylase [Patescibacteria group bacterium]|nr:peptide deformylase [Patescibacteria group bacterium]